MRGKNPNVRGKNPNVRGNNPNGKNPNGKNTNGKNDNVGGRNGKKGEEAESRRIVRETVLYHDLRKGHKGSVAPKKFFLFKNISV